MRRASVLILFLCCMSALAQPKTPPNLEPLPEPPPPPAMPGPDEPQVRIPVQEGDQVEELRDPSGHVRALKVTPPNGSPYYLVDLRGTGHWVRRDSLDADFRAPLWPIKTFD